jgi:hypothetical protein
MHSCRAFEHPRNLCSSLWPGVSLHMISPSSNTPRARTAHSQEFPSDTMWGVGECSWYAVCFVAPPVHHPVIEWTWRCTLRPWSSDFWGHHQASLDIPLDALIEPVWRHKCRPWFCQLGVCNRASLEIHSEAVIERVGRCTWSLWACEVWDALRGHDEASSVAIIERAWIYTWRLRLSKFGNTLGGRDCGNLGTK